MKYSLCGLTLLIAATGTCAESSLKIGKFQGRDSAGKKCSLTVAIDPSDRLIPYRGKTSFASTEFDLIEKKPPLGSDDLVFRGVTLGAKGAERLTILADKRGNPLSAAYLAPSTFNEVVCSLN